MQKQRYTDTQNRIFLIKQPNWDFATAFANENIPVNLIAKDTSFPVTLGAKQLRPAWASTEGYWDIVHFFMCSCYFLYTNFKGSILVFLKRSTNAGI